MGLRNSNFNLILINFLAFSFSIGCSVAQPLNGTDTAASSGGNSPLEPATPSQPVIVTEPVPILSPDLEDSPNEEPVASIPENKLPETHFPENSSDDADYFDIPDTIATIDETLANPAAEIVEADDVFAVVVPPISPPDSTSTDSQYVEFENPMPNVALEPDVAPEVIDERLPASLMEVVEIANPPNPSYDEPLEELNPDVSNNTDNDEDDSDRVIEDEFNRQDEEDRDSNGKLKKNKKETEFTVNGNCLGKKRAGVVWYDKRNKRKKKSKSVLCRNNKFKTKIKEKNKHLKFIELQTLFFD
jgi:hypothetical protein